MFYQNNNDYMRDAFFYSTPQNATYQNACGNGFSPMNNMHPQMLQNSMMPQQNMQIMPVSSMYPQIYRIINPVANRVISNTNCPYITEDTLNNMVDTVYNIVEGDVSTLSSTVPTNSGDDTVTQGPGRTSTQTTTVANNNSNNNSRQTTMAETSRTATTTVMSRNNNSGENQLLRDIIKIIIIKELLSRQMNRFSSENYSNFTGFPNNSNNFYDPRMFGFI